MPKLLFHFYKAVQYPNYCLLLQFLLFISDIALRAKMTGYYLPWYLVSLHKRKLHDYTIHI